MRFETPIPFDIPDKLWAALAADGWHPSVPQYTASAYRNGRDKIHDDLTIECVALDQIVPPVRTSGLPWFNDERLLRALQGMVAGETIPAVLGQRRNDDPTTRVQLVDGMHRFYASAALGFTHLPVAIQPWLEW